MTSHSAPTWLALVASIGSTWLLVAGCAMPGSLGLANLEANPLENLTQTEDKSEPSPYPTALSNPNRQQVSRPVVAAAPQIVVQAPPPIALPAAAPALPLQQAGLPAPLPLNPQELAGRLPVRIGEASEGTKVSPPAVHEPAVPEPAKVDIQELLATKEQSWLSSTALVAAAATNVKPPASEPAPTPTASVVNPAEAKVADPKPSAEPTTPPVQPALSKDELLAKLIASVEQEIRERTDRKEEAEIPALEQKLRLLQLVADRSDDAVEKIDQLPPAEREAFKQLMFALSTWLSPDEAKRASLRNAKVLRTLQEVDSRLAAISKLDLKNLTFCEKVESFGWFTEFPRAEFSPKQQVILYVEVQNFAAEEKSATSFETELQGSYQIFDAAGNIVDERQLPLDREVCRNFRRDYFLAYRIYLPGELAPGRYRLELAIEDLKAKQDFKGRKQGEAMIEFSIK